MRYAPTHVRHQLHPLQIPLLSGLPLIKDIWPIVQLTLSNCQWEVWNWPLLNWPDQPTSVLCWLCLVLLSDRLSLMSHISLPPAGRWVFQYLTPKLLHETTARCMCSDSTPRLLSQDTSAGLHGNLTSLPTTHKYGGYHEAHWVNRAVTDGSDWTSKLLLGCHQQEKTVDIYKMNVLKAYQGQLSQCRKIYERVLVVL